MTPAGLAREKWESERQDTGEGHQDHLKCFSYHIGSLLYG